MRDGGGERVGMSAPAARRGVPWDARMAVRLAEQLGAWAVRTPAVSAVETPAVLAVSAELAGRH